MSALTWMMGKIGHRDRAKYKKMVDAIARENGVSPLRVKADMYLNVLTQGCGFSDYYCGDYFNATPAEKKTFLTTRSYYRLLEYLNDEGYANVMRNKILFDDVFHAYLGRDFLNLRVAGRDEFVDFIAQKKAIFAKQESGFGGHGISRVDLGDVVTRDAAYRLFDDLRERKQFLVEDEIEQIPELNEVNPSAVASHRVVTLVKDGRSYLMGNALRVNGADDPVIGCTGDIYFSLDENGAPCSKAINDDGDVFERHPITGKRFADVRVPHVREAFDLCLRAALEVPQVRYVGWDVAYSIDGPVLMEGNAYPAYILVQFSKMYGKRTGHLKDVEAVLGDEMKMIRL